MITDDDKKAAEEWILKEYYQGEDLMRNISETNQIWDKERRGFKAGLQHERSKSQWISVEERLPEIGQSILVWSVRGTKYPAEGGPELGNYQLWLWQKNSPEQIKDDFFGTITYWKPLSEPPAEPSGGSDV